MIHNNLPQFKLNFLACFRRKLSRINESKFAKIFYIKLVPLLSEAMQKCANNIKIFSMLFSGVLFPAVSQCEEIVEFVNENIQKMLMPTASYEVKTLGISLVTDLALVLKRAQGIFDLQKTYKNALSLFPNSIIAEHLVLLQIEKIAKSPYGEFASQYFFSLLLRNLRPAKNKEEILTTAWTIHVLHIFIKEKLLSFEITYDSIHKRLLPFENYLNSLITGIGNIQFSIEEQLLVQNILEFYNGFAEFCENTLKIREKLFKPEFDESQKNTMVFNIRERCEKIMKIYELLSKIIKTEKNEKIMRKAAKTLSKIINFVLKYAIDYTASYPNELSSLEIKKYKDAIILKEMHKIFDSILENTQKSLNPLYFEESGFNKLCAEIIKFELSEVAADNRKVEWKNFSEISIKTPTFNKADYEKIFMKIIAHYLANKNANNAYVLLSTLKKLDRNEIQKMPNLIYVLCEILRNHKENDKECMKNLSKFLKKFYNCYTEYLSFTMNLYGNLIENLNEIALKIPIKSINLISEIYGNLLVEITLREKTEFLQKITENILNIAFLQPKEKIYILLRGIKKSITNFAENKNLIPLDIRKKISKNLKIFISKFILNKLKMNKEKFAENIGKSNKINANWIKTIFILYQLASIKFY